MRVLYLHQYFVDPAASGGTRSYEMARRMVAAGHEVHVITSRRERDRVRGGWEVTESEGFMVHSCPVPYSNRMGYAQRVLAFVRFASVAGSRAASVGGDVVFATSTPLTIAIPGVFAARRLGVPMVFEVRDLWPELPIAIGAIRSPAAKWVARHLETFAYRNSAHIVALSPGMAAGVARTGYPASRISVIPNSCDLQLFAQPGAPLPWDPGFIRMLSSMPLVVYTGTLGAINGVGYFVEVAAAALRIDPDVRFLIVGDGMEWDAVQRLAQERGVLDRNLFMRPPVSKRQMPTLLAMATMAVSLFVDMPEMWNNSANKFFDALAAGRAIAINYQGWQKELLEQSGAGIAVPVSDPGRAAAMICGLVRDREAVERAGGAARTLAMEKFDRDRLAQQLIGILERVARQ